MPIGLPRWDMRVEMLCRQSTIKENAVWQALIFIAIVFILLSIVVEAIKFLIWVGLLIFIVVAILYVLNQIKR